MSEYTPKQLEFLAKVIDHTSSLVESAQGNEQREVRLGSRKMPDGRTVELFLTAKSRAPLHPAGTHGMAPPGSSE